LTIKVEEHLRSLQSLKEKKKEQSKAEYCCRKDKVLTFTRIVFIDVRVLNICCSTSNATLKCWINLGTY